MAHVQKMYNLKPGIVKAIVVTGHGQLWAEEDPVVSTTVVGVGKLQNALASAARLTMSSGAPAVRAAAVGSFLAEGLAPYERRPRVAAPSPAPSPSCPCGCVQVIRPGTVSLRSTRTNLDLINKPVHRPRATKIVCTIGPASWDEDKIEKLLDAGLDIVRFNFSHGDHDGHLKVLERFRNASERKAQKLKDSKLLPCKPSWATLLDTKGPEIRTAMLREGKNITLEAGQDIVVEAVGDRYTQFEGYKTDKETRIGLSYSKLCQSVKPGNKILLADGTVSIEVVEILSETELRGRVLNTKELGQRKNCNLPGVKVDLPVLMDKDIDDLQNFACKHKMDYVAASFVQSAEDVRFIRRVLDEAGGEQIRIISKIENSEGLKVRARRCVARKCCRR